MNGAVLFVAEGGRVRFMSTALILDTTIVDPPTGEGGCVHTEVGNRRQSLRMSRPGNRERRVSTSVSEGRVCSHGAVFVALPRGSLVRPVREGSGGSKETPAIRPLTLCLPFRPILVTWRGDTGAYPL